MLKHDLIALIVFSMGVGIFLMMSILGEVWALSLLILFIAMTAIGFIVISEKYGN